MSSPRTWGNPVKGFSKDSLRANLFILFVWELLWTFIVTAPLVVSSPLGYAIKISSGAIILGFLVGAVRIIFWVEAGQKTRPRQIVAWSVAIGTGLAIFALAYVFRGLLTNAFHDWSFFSWGR